MGESVSPRKLQYVHEVLDTLQAISGKRNAFDLERQVLKVNESKGGVTVYDFIDIGIDRGKKQGIAIGERQGIAIGENTVICALAKLKDEGRKEDILRAISDKAYMDSLLGRGAI